MVMVMAVVVAGVAQPATAQVYYYPAQPTYYPVQTQSAAQTEAQQVAYLQSVIASLQQQLQTLLAARPTYQFGYQYQNQLQPNVAPSTYFPPYYTGVEVRALSPTSIDTDSATLRGEIRFRGVERVETYFEYDTSRAYRDRTTSRTVYADRDGVTEVDAEIDDIERGETYYYRLVAIDQTGQILRSSEQAFSISTGGNGGNGDDDPEATTDDARDIEEDEAEISGDVDMNDFEDGRVVFVYGQDEDEVEEAEDEDRYDDIDEQDEDLQKIVVDSSLDDSEDYDARITGLDDDTDYFFRICVEYEDDDDDEQLVCGDVEEFTTDN